MDHWTSAGEEGRQAGHKGFGMGWERTAAELKAGRRRSHLSAVLEVAGVAVKRVQDTDKTAEAEKPGLAGTLVVIVVEALGGWEVVVKM